MGDRLGPGEAAQEGGLSGAGGSEQADAFARMDREVDVLQEGLEADVEAQPLGLDADGSLLGDPGLE